MKKETALKIILVISIAGLLFSGYLSYTELFAGYCGASQLGMGSCTNVMQIPACVYGFAMYMVVFIISLLGLKNKKQ
ncbi:MAG TPA: hypothetical protein P5277_01890 [Candidatus Paceibacterota bacterium]|nr:hypothetical protein [Candidatus Paceibacterota bacterium]